MDNFWKFASFAVSAFSACLVSCQSAATDDGNAPITEIRFDGWVDAAKYPDSISWRTGNDSGGYLNPLPAPNVRLEIHASQGQSSATVVFWRLGIRVGSYSIPMVANWNQEKSWSGDAAGDSLLAWFDRNRSANSSSSPRGVQFREFDSLVASRILRSDASLVLPAGFDSTRITEFMPIDSSLVPVAKYHWGSFIAPFAMDVSGPSESSVYWWNSASPEPRLLTGPVWIGKSGSVGFQVRSRGRIGPAVQWEYSIKDTISFEGVDPNAKYQDGTNAIAAMLMGYGVSGYGWLTGSSTVVEVKKGDYFGVGKNMVRMIANWTGENPNWGIGFNLGGSVVQSAPDSGIWHADLSSLDSVVFSVRFSGVPSDSVELAIQLASVDAGYNAACGKGGCLRHSISAAALRNSGGLVRIAVPVDSLRYPSWYVADHSDTVDTRTVLKWGCGINFAIGSKGVTLGKAHQDTLVVGGIVFKRKPSAMPAGAVSVIP